MITYDRTVHSDHCPREETMTKTCKNCNLSKCHGNATVFCSETVGQCNDQNRWQPIGGTMKYKVLKDISLLTIAQAGPSNCQEFEKEFYKMAQYMDKVDLKLATTYFSGEEQFTGENKLFTWLTKSIYRTEWLIDKGFIERVEDELKPCPFCGSTNLALGTFWTSHRVVCNSCNASGPHKETKRDAKDAWKYKVRTEFRASKSPTTVF
jgi:Lar family restriction alleviation protein